VSKLLVIEDEAPLRRALRIFLEAHDYEVVIAGTGSEGLDVAAREHPDAIVLDLGLPDMDGVDVATALRGWSNVPIVVLSARDAEAVKVAALDAGADDYVTKPFGMNEFLARLRAALRRAAPAEEAPVVATPDFTVDLGAKRICRDGEDVHLTPTEFALLRELAVNRGKLLSRAHLLRRVWGQGYETETEYIRVYISRLRAKLEPPGSRPLIVTRQGAGYRMAG